MYFCTCSYVSKSNLHKLQCVEQSINSFHNTSEKVPDINQSSIIKQKLFRINTMNSSVTARASNEREIITNYHHFSLTFDPREVIHRLGDVRFVLVAGCHFRTEAQADYLVKRLFNGQNLPKLQLERLTKSRSRFNLIKVGPVLISDHGMGPASMSIAMHELFLMCREADVINKIVVIRFGTCGGIGVEPGTICITSKAMDSMFQEWIDYKICGKIVRRNCIVHQETAKLIEYLALKYQEDSCSQEDNELGEFDVRRGGTVSTNDFYEEQGRTNGAICDHTHKDKMTYLAKAQLCGVINMEMEANYLAAMCHKLQVPFGVFCVALNNRLREDEKKLEQKQMDQFERRLFWLNSIFIKHKLSSQSDTHSDVLESGEKIIYGE